MNPEALILLDPERRTVRIPGQIVHFTKREFDLLAALIAADGRILTRSWIEENVWEDEMPLESDTIKTTINAIRKKLGPERHALATVRGVGYRFVCKKEDRV